ncbi:MAG: S-layer homology domain-containing protein [Clostridia bacterium]|nr:S-layer homology domain-containing protein [Clostridia bacterium]
MKNKILSLVLALLMAASSASAVLANDDVALIDETAEEVAVVDEVEAGQYDKAIAFLANYGIMKGITDNDFGAELDVQRYQMALFVARISTGWINDHQWLNAPENWTAFTDISEGPAANYWGALSYASQAGIIEGYGNGKFGPEDQITYQNALTMVVRTLGYDGLDWPWGYIQKAVELGLTEGITGVSYTDNLTRGEVAQIIYNAMFAKMKNGSNLALKNFGIEFGWEKVVVTASDLNTFVADKEDAEKKLKNDTTPYWNKSNKPSKGFVTFQLLNDDGSLADDVYYVQASELGLKGDHDDEAAVGEAYYVLFEKDEDGLAKVAAYESLKLGTIWNEGKTDDDGDAQDYAIKEFLEDYALVGKYTTNEYLNVTASTKNEIMVYAANGVMTEKTIKDNLVAIDWVTGDILVPVDKNEDGKWDLVEGTTDKYVYDVEWYYNDVTGKYWNYRYDTKYENLVGRDWMTEKEFSDTYAKYFEYKDHTYKGFATTVDKIADSAYASLEIFDTNLDGVADRGIYESYALGYFTEDKHSDNKSYKISRVDTFGLAEKAAKLDDAYSVTGIEIFNEIQEGIKDGDDADRAWFVEGYTPVAEYDEDGEFTGYKAGYVVYNYDAETGAIKVVKNIDGSDEDSYTAKGVLRAYNITAGTITIDEETYHFDQYAELEGNGFKYVKENAKTKAIYTAELRKLFNQFVKFVVVDGEIVDIDAIGDTTTELIVVESYAGLSSDGYIVVNGYSTNDLVYTQFKIASYDGWQKGDYYYYLTDKAAAESFTKGAIYTITSKDGDIYNVALAGEFDEVDNDGNAYGEYTVYGYETKLTKLTATEDGYVLKQTWDKTKKDGLGDWTTGSYIKMNSDDKYVIVDAWEPNDVYASVQVYVGKLPANAVISGEVVKYSDGSSDTYVFVNVTSAPRFDKYDAGLVVLLRDAYYSASYNGTGAEDWYLLGASEYTVATVDILTGNLEHVVGATNKKYEKGLALTTQGNVLTLEEGFFVDADEIVDWVARSYTTDTYKAAKIANLVDAKSLYNTKDSKHKEAIENMIFGEANYRGDKVNTVTYRVISIDKDGYVEKIDDSVYGNDNNAKLDSYITKNSYTTVPAFYIYNVETKNIVIYIVESDTIATIAGTDLAWSNEVVIREWAKDDAKITGKVGFTTTKVNGKIDTLTVKTIEFTFDGEGVKGLHSKIAEGGYAFGLADDHYAEKYDVTVESWKNGDADWTTDAIYTSIVKAEYADCADCELVKTIRVDLKTPIVVKLADLNEIQIDVAVVAKDSDATGFDFFASVDGKWTTSLKEDGSLKEVKLVIEKDNSETNDFVSPAYPVHAVDAYVADLLD